MSRVCRMENRPLSPSVYVLLDYNMQISICIATYKRPLLLNRLLSALECLKFEKVPRPGIEIIVVDNDPEASAEQVCKKLQSTSKWQIRYSIETSKGVTHARNRSIANASAASDFIAMIDDDEYPHHSWLEELLLTQAQYQADVVTGPVFPIFEDDVPEWVKKGHFFDPKDQPTGQSLPAAFTGNVLARLGLLKSSDKAFDDRFATKGSEDSYLFMRLRKTGAKIIWSQEAIAYESIPGSRTNLAWLLQRSYWGYSSYSLFEKEIYPSRKVQIIRAVKGVALLGQGMVTLLPAGFAGKHRFYGSCINVARGLGTLSGLLGLQGNWRR